jgi:hypothetical protein
MDQQTYINKLKRSWRDFSDRYVSVSFAWKGIVYITIFSALLLIPVELFYYDWATSEEARVRSIRQEKLAISAKELEEVRARLSSMEVDYENAKSERFDISEPRTAQVSGASGTSTAPAKSATSTESATSTTRQIP